MTQNINIVIQAGGRGSRLRHHTWNKPKCLVSVNGKPILYHLFDDFPNARFLIICDYAFDILEKYLQVNPPTADCQLVKADGKGTISGIPQALRLIDDAAPLLIVWSDLSFDAPLPIPEKKQPIIYTTSAFTCRWSIAPDGELEEKASAETGVPGIFYFPEKTWLSQLPAEGEFVRWLSKNLHQYEVEPFDDLREIGEFAAIEASNDRQGFSRFFNKVDIGEHLVTKTVVDPAYKDVHEKEVGWYREARRMGFRRIPRIESENPLVMERIMGRHAYQMTDLTDREQRAVLSDYVDTLEGLHQAAIQPCDFEDTKAVYLEKTIKRVGEVSRLIPGFEKDSMTINGKKCRNLFHEKYSHELTQLLPYLVPDYFCAIHGDPTFSNSLVDENLSVWFIDPRGYFAKPGIAGDPWYDFAKVYYSAVGGYDNFNRRKFKLYIDDETVEILMDEPIFKKNAQQIFDHHFGANMSRINVIHGLIWLALSGYAKDDVDSIIGSFYAGLYWLETGTRTL